MNGRVMPELFENGNRKCTQFIPQIMLLSLTSSSEQMATATDSKRQSNLFDFPLLVWAYAPQYNNNNGILFGKHSIEI